jgi:hypothetical protein
MVRPAPEPAEPQENKGERAGQTGLAIWRVGEFGLCWVVRDGYGGCV